jgi:transcriptional regulator with XRE-family HTH domain
MSRLQEIRKERGLTQQQLASALKVTDVAVSRWEKHEPRLNIPLLRQLAERRSIVQSLIWLPRGAGRLRLRISCDPLRISARATMLILKAFT